MPGISHAATILPRALIAAAVLSLSTTVFAQGFPGGVRDALGPAFGKGKASATQRVITDRRLTSDTLSDWHGVALDATGLDHTPVANANANTGAAPLPIFDSHLHYSHDAWEQLPPKAAIEIVRKAGLKAAMVSSSSDDGTLKLYAEAPDLVIPVLRPYRTRGELGTWVCDATIITHLESRLASHRYVALGEYDDVVRHHSELDEGRLHADGARLLQALKLTPQQAADLAAFLKTLGGR